MMWSGLALMIGSFAIVIGLGWMIYSAIVRIPKKKAAIILGTGVVLVIIGFVLGLHQSLADYHASSTLEGGAFVQELDDKKTIKNKTLQFEVKQVKKDGNTMTLKAPGNFYVKVPAGKSADYFKVGRILTVKMKKAEKNGHWVVTGSTK